MARRSVRWGHTGRWVGVAAVVGAVSAFGATATPLAPVPAKSAKGTISVLKDQWGNAKADATSLTAAEVYSPVLDPGSLFTVTTAIGARTVWGQHDGSGRAVTGQGVTVALLDSGVAPVEGLAGGGKVTQGPDLSLESANTSLAYRAGSSGCKL